MTGADQPGAAISSPVLPYRVIRPRTGWVALDLAELWSYRELGYFLVWRDLKIRYKQTAFGVLWAVIQPLGLMAVFSLVLGRVANLSTPGAPYPLFAFAGLVPWTLFSQSLVGSADSLVSASNLIQKVSFRRLLLPLASIASFLVDFLIAAAILAIALLIQGGSLSANVIWVLPATGLTILASLAVGVWLAAINVRYRDVRYAVPFLVQVWLFASPVAYSIDVVPPEWRTLYQLNPMAGAVEGFRWAMLGQGTPPPIEAVAISVAVTVFLFALGLAYFRRMEVAFADVI